MEPSDTDGLGAVRGCLIWMPVGLLLWFALIVATWWLVGWIES